MPSLIQEPQTDIPLTLQLPAYTILPQSDSPDTEETTSTIPTTDALATTFMEEIKLSETENVSKEDSGNDLDCGFI